MVATESSQVVSLYQLRPHLKVKGHGLPWKAEGGNPLRHRLQLVAARRRGFHSSTQTDPPGDRTLEAVVMEGNSAVYRKVRGKETAIRQDAGWQERDGVLTIRTRELRHPLRVSGFFSPFGRNLYVLAEFPSVAKESGFKPPENIHLPKDTPIQYLTAKNKPL